MTGDPQAIPKVILLQRSLTCGISNTMVYTTSPRAKLVMNTGHAMVVAYLYMSAA